MGDKAGCRVVGLNRKPQHGGDRRRHQAWIAQHAEIDEQQGAAERLDQMMRTRDRKRRLADAAEPTTVTNRAALSRVDSLRTSSSRPTIPTRRAGRFACEKPAVAAAAAGPW